MSDLENTQADAPAADQEAAPVLDHNALAVIKDPKDNQWKLITVQFNTDGALGGYRVVKSTQFRGEAIEWFKIESVRMGFFG